MNYRMTIQYDGTRYSGWQRQGNTAGTIQNRLERELSHLLGEETAIHGSGRTDAGVHALGQVASFHTKGTIACETFLADLNRALPGDIAVTELVPAAPRFHARLHAIEKTYRYTVLNSPISDVFGRRFSYQLDTPLNPSVMEEGAQLLLGTHDFVGFSTGHTKKSTIRTLKTLSLSREGSRLELYFTGDGFLYNMVRILTGTLLEIGMGRRTIETIPMIFETGDRRLAGFTAPPQGLCLMEVVYPPQEVSSC